MARARAEYSIDAEDRTGAAIASAKRGFQGLRSAGGAVGRSIGAGAGVAFAGLATMTKAAIDAGDRVQKLAIQSGLSTEYLSEMGHVAELQGASIESFGQASRRMSTFLLDAARGSKTAADTLDRLGLSMDEVNKLSQEQRIDAFLGALHQVPDAAERAALAQQVFGRAGEDMVRIADLGTEGIANLRAEANKLGLTLSRDQADAMAAANDGLTRLQASMRGFANQLAAEFAPGIADGAEILAEVLLPTLRGVAGSLRTVGKLIGGVAAAGAALGRGEFSESASIIGAAFDDLFSSINDGIDRLVDGADEATGAIGGRGGVLVGAGGGGSVTLDAPQLDEQTRYLREIANNVGAARAG